MQTKNIRQVLICGYDSGNSAVTAGNAASTVTIPSGQMAVVNPRNGNVILNTTTGATVQYIKIAYHSPSLGKLVFSDEIDGKNITNYLGYIPVVDQDQIYYLGYNGTSGSIDVENRGKYLVSLSMTGQSGSALATARSTYGYHVAAASATQVSIAKGLVENLVANISQWKEKPYKFEVISDGSITAFPGTAADHITVKNGSDIVTLQDAHTLSAGSWISLLGIDYYIKSVPSTTTIQLNIPYQGETGYIINSGATSAITATVGGGTGITTSKNVTLSAAHSLPVGAPCWMYLAGTIYAGIVGGTTPTTDITIYKAATDDAGVSIAGNGYYAANGTNWGIKITGKEGTYSKGKSPAVKVSFDIVTSDTFDDTTKTASQYASPGRGMGKRVVEDDYICQGEEYPYRSLPNTPGPTWRTDADVTKLYSQLILEWYDGQQSEIGHMENSPKQLVIYAESSQNRYETIATGNVDICMTDNTTGVADVLDEFIVTKWGNGSAQDGNI